MVTAVVEEALAVDVTVALAAGVGADLMASKLSSPLALPAERIQNTKNPPGKKETKEEQCEFV